MARTRSANRLLIAAPLLAMLLAGCAGETEDDAFAPGGCGLSPYAWLPAEQVGTAVSHGEVGAATAEDTDLQLIMLGLEALAPVEQGARLLEMRYTTQDRGEPVEASGYVALPWDDGPTGRAHPVMLYLHGTSGVAHECAQGSDGDLLRTLAMLIAAKEYIAVVPDYIGLDHNADLQDPPPTRHAWFAMEPTAVASLDALRAAEALAARDRGLLDGPEPWSCYLRENSPVHATRVRRTRRTPMLFQVSGEDEIVPPAGSRAAFEALCRQGYQLEYLECAGVGHTKGGVDSLPEQLEWLAARLAGQPIPAADLCRLRDAVTCSGNSPL